MTDLQYGMDVQKLQSLLGLVVEFVQKILSNLLLKDDCGVLQAADQPRYIKQVFLNHDGIWV